MVAAGSWIPASGRPVASIAVVGGAGWGGRVGCALDGAARRSAGLLGRRSGRPHPVGREWAVVPVMRCVGRGDGERDRPLPGAGAVVRACVVRSVRAGGPVPLASVDAGWLDGERGALARSHWIWEARCRARNGVEAYGLWSRQRGAGGIRLRSQTMLRAVRTAVWGDVAVISAAAESPGGKR